MTKKLHDTSGPKIDRENISKSRASRPLKPSDLPKSKNGKSGLKR